MTQGSVVQQQVSEQEYREHREMARAMLARDFPSLSDPDEIYHEAWLEALEMRARGQELVNLGGLLRLIVWRRARDHFRDLRAQPADPSSAIFDCGADPELPPDEQAERSMDVALAKLIVESLDERQAAAIKLRFNQQMARKDIERQLGVTRKRL